MVCFRCWEIEEEGEKKERAFYKAQLGIACYNCNFNVMLCWQCPIWKIMGEFRFRQRRIMDEKVVNDERGTDDDVYGSFNRYMA